MILPNSIRLIVPGECLKGGQITDRHEASSEEWKDAVAYE